MVILLGNTRYICYAEGGHLDGRVYLMVGELFWQTDGVNDIAYVGCISQWLGWRPDYISTWESVEYIAQLLRACLIPMDLAVWEQYILVTAEGGYGTGNKELEAFLLVLMLCLDRCNYTLTWMAWWTAGLIYWLVD